MYVTHNIDFELDRVLNSTLGPVIGISADLKCYNSGWHTHQQHELLFSKEGGIKIEVEQSHYLIPPACAAWIPAGTLHKTTTQAVIAFRSIFITPDASLPNNLLIASVTPLFREVIERIAYWPWDKPAKEQQPLLQVFKEELATAAIAPWKLTFPQDRRLTPLLDIIKQEQLPPKLGEIASYIGASDKTIGRIFLRETGLNYQTWRQQWRLIRAMELLAKKHSVSSVAQKLDFASSSAFIAFFQQHTNQTPGRFLHD
ncbi:helix-turn-helix transcriptional regulator [Photobacterium chitinilyticum]|uniref:AraC family transcriptional regulator n=1 Tax=Photobacterium chitinilyticum TaxID=2485123 RepID=UPI003D0A49E0